MVEPEEQHPTTVPLLQAVIVVTLLLAIAAGLVAAIIAVGNAAFTAEIGVVVAVDVVLVVIFLARRGLHVSPDAAADVFRTASIKGEAAALKPHSRRSR